MSSDGRGFKISLLGLNPVTSGTLFKNLGDLSQERGGEGAPARSDQPEGVRGTGTTPVTGHSLEEGCAVP